MKDAYLSQQLEAYLTVRAALGFQTHATGLLLCDFLRYLEARQLSSPLRAQVAIDWVCDSAVPHQASTQVQRLSIVRGFLAFLRASQPETELPDHRLLARPKRPTPYLFTAEQITQLLSAVARMKPAHSLRPHAWRLLLGLLVSTGLRVGEACRLEIGDLHLTPAPPYLHIRETKFRKSRLVPLHTSAVAELNAYLEKRQALGYAALSDTLLLTEWGKPFQPVTLWRTFKRLTQRLGMRPPAGDRPPSLHSLRHTFAVNRLCAWYREGRPVQELVPQLSVYLGHMRPQESYWYLTATPELLGAASTRFAQFADPGGAL
ncbi:MAG TPA: tyrosine-type recombinase/integrase [Blastocatellia bacterium]|nr:tyrosine-type recombinase/integrase [Blastocatellia bacterium]